MRASHSSVLIPGSIAFNAAANFTTVDATHEPKVSVICVHTLLAFSLLKGVLASKERVGKASHMTPENIIL